MYPDAGPSRTGNEYARDVPPPRQASGRYELDYEDRGNGYGRGHETPNRSIPASSPWSRPPPRASFRPYSNGPPRARTPSPPRQISEWDRDRPRPKGGSRERDRERPMDVRDRLSLDAPYRSSPGGFSEPTRRPGPFSGPPSVRDGGRDQPAWDRERRWGTPREDRYAGDDTRSQPRRSFSPNKQSAPYSRDRISNPSPPKPRPGPPSTPWNGSSRNTPLPRSSFHNNPRDRDDRDRPNIDRNPFAPREISGDFSRTAEGGPGPNTFAYQASTRSSPAGTPPRQLRSLRGSSSPVESRHPHRTVEDPGRSAVGSAPVPNVKTEVEEGELEEGEVVSSPVRPDREVPLARQLDLTPSTQPRDRYRDWPTRREPFDRNRERERRWPNQPQQQISDRPANRGPNDPVQATQPWKNGQSVDDGWGRRNRPDETGRSRSADRDERSSPLRRQSSHGEQPVGETVKEEAKDIQAEMEDEDRPLTPPLPPKEETVITRRISINTSLAIPRLSSEDPDRPDTPALPAFLQNTISASPRISPSSDKQVEGIQPSGELATDPIPSAERPMTPRRSLSPPLLDQHVDQAMLIDGSIAASGEDAHNGLSLDVQAEVAPLLTPITPAQPILAVDEAVPLVDDNYIVSASPEIAKSTMNLAETVSATKTRDDAAFKQTQVSDPDPMSPSDLIPTPRPPFSPLLTSKPRSPAARQPTLAERRSIVLPPTQGPLSSPFGERMLRRDPAPTNDSLQESTDTELFPRTADIEEAGSDTDEDAPMSRREVRLIGAMKRAQGEQRGLDVDAIMAWNLAAAPPPSGRPDYQLSPEGREKRLREVTWPLDRQQTVVAHLVAKQVAKEHERTIARVEALQKEYQMLDEEWKEHCDYLDALMEKRGPPPESLYAVPNAVPVVTPGPAAPTTPIAVPEDLLSTRAIRRRGAGDAVTTEAEFQEILAAMADTAAKDPNYRASKTTAYVPDMLPPEERRLRFEDDNDLVDDPIAFYDFKGTAEPIWTEEERSIFVRRYLNFPKQFGKIAEALPDKTASDCVLYYYRTKKEVDYKSMLASRRGVTRRKVLPIKKGGKSAALLASLDQKKATVESTPMRAIPTPGRPREETSAPLSGSVARRGKPRSEQGVMMRRIVDVQAEERDRAGTPDQPQTRDGSEAPGMMMTSKGKIRMSMKGPKRPRLSSVSGVPGTPGNNGIHQNIDGPPGTDGTLTPTSELLPPVKRARKSRKSTATSDLTDIGPETSSVAASTTSNGRRSNTTSYWSVDEKRRLKDLLLVHGRDLRAIAAELPGKTERQIGNQIQMRPGEYGFDPGFADMDRIPGSTPYSQKDEYFKPSAGYSRSIYDVYSHQPAGYGHHEPRLGVFPSLPPSHPVTASATPSSHPGSFDTASKPAPRSGGMRISALLNDEPSQMSDIRRDGGDAMSDGTIEDRDEGIRPSPRGIPPVPQARRPSSSQEHHPEYDRYRSAPQAQGYIYHPAPVQSSAWQPRPGVPYYSRPMSPPLSRPTHSHSVPPTYHSAPTHLPPRSSAEYYRQRPEAYRAQSTSVVEAYRSYPPPPHHLPPQGHPEQSTTPPLPPTPGYAGRYDSHPLQTKWRGYTPTPQQQQGHPQAGQYPEQRRMSIHHPAPLSHQQGTSTSAPEPRQRDWYSSPEAQKGVTLPGIRNMLESNETPREG